jgi:signal transduction histidine kinase/ligand-binding sensor domain-containing protein
MIVLLECASVSAQDSDRAAHQSLSSGSVDIPRGSYMETCTDIKLGDRGLWAMCLDASRQHWVKTGLYDASACAGDIANLNGHLSCSDSTTPLAAPQKTPSVSAPGWERTIGQYQHTAWTAKDGAPSSVLALAQTTDGFLWVGAEDGLYRFDGVTFERYEPASWAAFPAGRLRVGCLLALPNGNLWVGLLGVISVLGDGSVRNYTAADGVPAGSVGGLAQDRKGTIWAATSAGLARLEGNRWRAIGRDWDFPGKVAHTVFVDGKGTLWVATQDTIVFLPAGTGQFEQTGVRVGSVSQFDEAPNGKLWMAETTRSVRPVPLGDQLLPSDNTAIEVGSTGILFDRDGALWITTLGDGMRRAPHPETLKGKVKEFSTTVESLTSKEGLSADDNRVILQDHEGSIWVGTRRGLDRFRKADMVSIALPFPADRAVLAAGDDGDLWVGNERTGRIVRVLDGRTYSVGELDDGPIGSYRDPHGTGFWLGLHGIFRSKNNQVSNLPLPPTGFSIPYNSPMRVTGDLSGQFWLAAGSKGLFRLKNGNWIKLEDGHELARLVPVAAFTDWLGRAWFAYAQGTIVIVNGTKIERLYSPQDSLVGIVKAIDGSDGHVWVGGDSGMALFKGNRFYPVIPADATQFRNILGIVETGDGDLWVCERRGVLHLPSAEARKVLDNPAYRVKYELFDQSDGLPGPFRDRDVWPTEIQGTNGRIWFATPDGIAWINPSNILKNTLAPPVVIRSASADGKQYFSLANLILPALTTSLRIGYTGLSLSAPERVRFRYKLAGVDEDWQDAGTRREAFYNNLGPASYRFRVIASNRDGVWNEQGATLDFFIAPAWYQTTFFRVSCLAVSLLLLWALYRRHLQQVERRFDIGLEARVNERTRIARDLHDTLLQSFQGLMLHLQLVEDLLPEGKAKYQLEQTLQRADQAIAEGRRAVYDLRSSTAAPTDLAEAVRSLGDEFATENSAAFHLVVEGAGHDLNPIIRDELYLVTREALRNAFVHARAHRIEAEIIYGERAFRVCIRDDGQGIPTQVLEEGRSGHYGLLGMRERAKQVGGKLDFWSRAGAGTEIELSIPGSIAYRTSVAGPLFSLFSLFGRKAG